MTAKRILGALSALLALLIFALAVFPASPALAVSQAEIDALEEQRDALKGRARVHAGGIDAAPKTSKPESWKRNARSTSRTRSTARSWSS